MTTACISRAVLSVTIFLGTQTACLAIDSSSFEYAVGNRTQIMRIAAQIDWRRQWKTSSYSSIGGYWELSGGRWRENRFHNIIRNTQHVNDIGLTPIFRLQGDDRSGLYAESGIGLHYLHGTYDNNGRRLSDNFQFGSHIGFGSVVFNRFDVGLRFQHISNGGIKKPNDGVNFVGVRMALRF